MTDITIHDHFEPGDRVYLQDPTPGGFVVVEQCLVYARSASVTFASVEPREHFHVTVARAHRKAADDG